MDVIETLVKHVVDTDFEDLPKEVVSVTKKAVLDTIGVMIGGSSVGGCKLLVDYINDWKGREESTIAVFGGKAPAPLAAQANGAMARALELDDIIDTYPLHPSASIVPACLATAERQGNIGGKDFITAVALGHDLKIRLASSITVSPIITGRCNLFKVFALAGCAGKLLRLSEDKLLNAVGIVYSQMVGDAQSMADGAMTSYIQQGTRAKSAIEAALMSQKGITGTHNVLQGQWGFYKAFEPNPNLGPLTEKLGEIFRGLHLSTKLHSACRCTHTPIDLAQQFRAEGVQWTDIDEVTVRVNDQSYNLVCQPIDRKRLPQTHVDAEFSIPFTTAAAFVRGEVFVREVTGEAIRDQNILQLAQRVKPISDPARNTDLVVGSVVMEVKMKSGKTLIKEAESPRGNPRNPASMDDCVEKFKKCITYSARSFDSKQVDRIIDMTMNLEGVDDVRKLGALLIPA